MTAQTHWIGPDGLPTGPDDPAVTAERASRLADELAAMTEQLRTVLVWQDTALELAAADIAPPVRRGRLADARRINTRARRTLALLRDCLGEQHVECDELAEQLRHQTDPPRRPQHNRRGGSGVMTHPEKNSTRATVTTLPGWLLTARRPAERDVGDPRARALTDPELAAVVAVALATLVLGVIGLFNSFTAVADAAEGSFGAAAWTVPLAVDVGILVFSALDLVLARLDMRVAWLRLVPWSLVGVTIYLNVADETTWFGRIAHAALPAMWVVAVEVGTHAVRTRAGLASVRRMDRIRASRWLLAPFATAGLWRRMVLWETRSYPDALTRERSRLLALTGLQDAYGHIGWRWKAPRRDRALYRLGNSPHPALSTLRPPSTNRQRTPLTPAVTATNARPGDTDTREAHVPGRRHGRGRDGTGRTPPRRWRGCGASTRTCPRRRSRNVSASRTGRSAATSPPRPPTRRRLPLRRMPDRRPLRKGGPHDDQQQQPEHDGHDEHGQAHHEQEAGGRDEAEVFDLHGARVRRGPTGADTSDRPGRPDGRDDTGPDTRPDSGPDMGADRCGRGGRGRPKAGPVLVDSPAAQRTPRLSVDGLRRAERRPIVPAYLRSAAEFRDTARWAVGHAVHATGYHVTRTPKYAGKLLIRAPRGRVPCRAGVGAVGVRPGGRAGPPSVACAARDATEYLALSKQRDRRVRWRGMVGTAGAVTTAGGGGALVFLAPDWIQIVSGLLAVVVFGLAGRVPDKPLLDRAVVVPKAAKLTSDVVVRALSVLGIGGITQALGKNQNAIVFTAPISRDGPGWRAEVDLPPGVTATEVVERRDKLAAGLSRPLGCVWPEGNSDVHPGRLVLWVGDQDMSKTRQAAWPLLRTGRVDLFEPFPFGTDQRGRGVAVTLMFASMVIGAIPRMGKTFALRLILLAAVAGPARASCTCTTSRAWATCPRWSRSRTGTGPAPTTTTSPTPWPTCANSAPS